MNKDNIKTGVWSAIAGAVITMIIGFSWGGWVTGGTAMDMNEESVRTAMTKRLAPICVAFANQDAEKMGKLQELKKANSWDRGQYVMDQGWATMPFEKEPDSGVADSCSELLMKGI